ncbi:cytochrome c oxidase assembly protein [Saccharothrix lopnurensis]|uniref:Cytochrome c oxidase assembly protein n=1 Tax=Saccharothrix lopnurensis TaxID=1670621 RepID=A0ABW1P7G5_9PSEU
MARHLLLGMVAPLGLVLGAPVTLLLRVADPRTRRWVGRVLRSRPVHVLGHPAVAALLSVGGLYAVVLTPLHRAAEHDLVLHHVLNLHHLAAGYLFTWSIAGPDPAPRRPGTTTRAVVFVLAAAAHAVLAKLLYADALALPPTGAGDAEALRAAARLMYHGGDLAELALATALFAGWYRRRARTGWYRRRARAPGTAHPPPRLPDHVVRQAP